MLKRTLSGIMLTLLLIGMLTAFNVPLGFALTRKITVPDDYPTIQEAINNANEGDTIYVKAGTYYENVVVNKTVSLIGENRNITVIDAGGVGSAIFISADNVLVNNFTLQNSGSNSPDSGIRISFSDNNTIYDNTLIDSYNGFHLWCSCDNVFCNNIITNVKSLGISIGESHRNAIYNNALIDANFYLFRSLKNTIENNVIVSSKAPVYSGVGVSESQNNTISNNIIRNCTNGIELYSGPVPPLYAAYNKITDNVIENNSVGIKITDLDVHDNVVYHNNFINNTQQVPSSDCTNIWDNGYPSGGNYWSDYAGVDVKSGPNQDQPSSEGIGDTAYVIDENNQDNYPLMHPYGSIRNLDTNLTYLTIQSAINAPETLNGHTIFVRPGTYYENINLKDGVRVQGAGANVTTINGKGEGSVVTAVDVGSGTLLSGFTITNGTTDGYGGGIYMKRSSLVVENNIIIANTADASGAGIFMSDNSTPTITGNIIIKNGGRYPPAQGGTVAGGGIKVHGSSPTITNNIIIENKAMYGGGVDFSAHGNGLLANNVIIGNTATSRGGGIDIYHYSSPNVINNIIANNNGTGIHVCFESYPLIDFNDIWNNIMGNYGGEASAGSNDISTDPMCINPAIGDYHLQVGSPCIDAGTNEEAPSIDFEGNPRPIDGDVDGVAIVDMGAYEFIPALSASISPLSASILVGESVIFTSTVSGGIPPYSYQWYLNGSAVPGATADSWTFTPVSVGVYEVYLNVTDSSGNIAISQIATVSVAPQITVSISPMSMAVIVGEPVTFTSTTSGGYPPYTYQWYLNGNPVSGATSNTWTFTPATSGIYYIHLKVTDAKGNTAQSEAARITVAAVPVGGYSLPIKGYTTEKPLTLYLALIGILTASFTIAKRRKKQQS